MPSSKQEAVRGREEDVSGRRKESRSLYRILPLCSANDTLQLAFRGSLRAPVCLLPVDSLSLPYATTKEVLKAVGNASASWEDRAGELLF